MQLMKKSDAAIHSDFKYIFSVTIPILLGYIPLGIGFGLFASQSGLPIIVSALMSIFMYTGAGQYLAVGLFAVNASFSSILITEILLNLRHIVYGLSLIREFDGIGKCKPYLIFALTDETYSVLTNTKCPQNINKKKFYLGVSALNHFYWVTGSLIGAFLGKILQSRTNIDFGGIDFALTALFAVLFVERMRNINVSKKNEELKKNETEKADNTKENEFSQNSSTTYLIEENKLIKKNNYDDFFACIIGLICTTVSVILWRFGIINNSSNILLFSIVTGVFIIIIKSIRSLSWNICFIFCPSPPRPGAC